jgi:hypothetical protein
MSLDLEDIGSPSLRPDFSRANGAPMVMVDGKRERYSRPSSFGKPLDDDSALVNWRLDRVGIGVAGDRALQARYAAVSLDDREELSALREAAISAGRGAEAADVGTALHAMSVRWEQGDTTFNPPEEFRVSLQAYTGALEASGLRSIHYEFACVNVENRCAGTADRLYEFDAPLITPDGEILPVGTIVVGDLKTNKRLDYSFPSYAVQLALYAGARLYDVVADEFLDTPPINQDWAIIAWMPSTDPGRCELFWVPLEIGRYGLYIVGQIKIWRKNWRSGEFACPILKPPGMSVAEVAEALGGELIEEPVVVESEPTQERTPLMHDAPPWSELHDPEPKEPEVVEVLAPVLSIVPPADDDGLPDGMAPEPDRFKLGIEWARTRLSLIGKNEKAKQWLMVRWPEGLPTPRQGIETEQELDQVLALLAKCEAEHGLGFVEQPAGLLFTGSYRAYLAQKQEK